MGTGDLLYLTFLFGLWLVVVASVIFFSVGREAGSTLRGRGLTRWHLILSVALVAAYFSVALPAFQFLPMDASYSIIVAAFGIANALQGAQFWIGLVCARRMRLAKPPLGAPTS